MLFNVFDNLNVSSSATNTISFNGYDRIFFAIKNTMSASSGTIESGIGGGGSGSIGGGGTTTTSSTPGTLSFYATNDTVDVLIKTYTDAELIANSQIGLSFRGCPHEIKVVYTTGTSTGTIDIIANIVG